MGRVIDAALTFNKKKNDRHVDCSLPLPQEGAMSTQKNFERTFSKAKWLSVISLSITCFSPVISHADMSEADYQTALSAVQKKVERTRSAGQTALSLNPQSTAALSSTSIRNLLGRTYQVGDRWQVAAWSAENAMARMTGD